MARSIYQIFSGTQRDLFNTVIDRVDYLKELHIDTVWFTPFNNSNSYHNYDAVDYYSIKREIGTLGEFRKMCKVLKQNDIDVMLDMVFCHTSNEHSYFIDNPEYYQWSSVKLDKEHVWNCQDQSSHMGEDWHYDERMEAYYYGAFDKTMPSLNLDNEDVQDEIERVCNYWLKQGVSCFRLDAIIHSHRNIDDSTRFWKWFKEMVGKEVFIVGEAWSDYNTINKYNNSIDSCFDFPLQGNLLWRVKTLNFMDLRNDLLSSNGNLTLFTGNHDMNRMASILDYDVEKIKLYLWLNVLLAQENRCLYYMDEIGLGGYKDQGAGDLGVRGEWDLDETERQLDDENSILNSYIKAVELVDKCEVLRNGKIIRVEAQPEYNRLAIYKALPSGERVKIKIQPSNKNYDKYYVVASYCGYDVVIMKYGKVI